ncbi:siderophore-interacting protein [Nocardioides sp. YIM 152315]|uniref:siderophore-interacting protein n=1 Tax=Nocardioides sp. YIM 152315 TaxID=3031760 RepID=UPI0023DB07C3|nr:siderophore-interacting protein [Nocardioides sp. YIM 152315]MDF1605856.1 siderophore-interacting protein [Nocardioides sp. YIM 152315]
MTRLVVTSTEDVTPSLRRIWFHSDDLSALAGFDDQSDRYVKLVFPKAGVELPEGLSMRELRIALAPEDLPVVRTYTAPILDITGGIMAIDFVVHGDHGVAGPWARSATAGSILYADGIGGGYRPDPSADAHLIAGDDCAVPAIGAALAALPAEAEGQVFILVESAADEPPMPAPHGVKVTFLHRTAGQSLARAIREWPWPHGRVQAFVHGEAKDVMHGVRPYLLKDRALPLADTSISGYWRHGRTEEGFRQWKSDLAAAEGNN